MTRSPIDATTTAGRPALQSYIWPDEPERIARAAREAIRSAFASAAGRPG